MDQREQADQSEQQELLAMPAERIKAEAKWRLRKQRVLGLTFFVTFLLALLLGAGMLNGAADTRRNAATSLAANHAQRLSHRLLESMGPAYMLASMVQQGKGRVENFEAGAAEILQLFPMVSSVQIAPNGVIEKIFPLPGNEAAVGHDLLRSSSRRQEAHQAIVRRQLSLGGPYALVQGGVGVVGRFPVFLPDANGWAKFWGFTIVVVQVPPLLEAAGLPDVAQAGYRFELCREQDDDVVPCDVFARRGEGRPEDPVTVKVEVPNGVWQLSLSPEHGWITPGEKLLWGCGSLVLALFVVLLQRFMLGRFSR